MIREKVAGRGKRNLRNQLSAQPWSVDIGRNTINSVFPGKVAWVGGTWEEAEMVRCTIRIMDWGIFGPNFPPSLKLRSLDETNQLTTGTTRQRENASERRRDFPTPACFNPTSIRLCDAATTLILDTRLRTIILLRK